MYPMRLQMWLQGIAIILPRVQGAGPKSWCALRNLLTALSALFFKDQFAVSDSWIGALSSSMFAGMMVGAIAWGSCESSKSALPGGIDR